MFQIYSPDERVTYTSDPEHDLYQYRVFIGDRMLQTDPRSSYWYLDETNGLAVARTGASGMVIESKKFCVEIFGYTPEYRASSYTRGTDLPYVNGCSTKQLIPPARPGDPTLQMLLIPKGCKEQEHHIHATARVVYVLKGKGRSIVGMGATQQAYDLYEGQTLILGKMIPHHFETTYDDLVVIPMHIYSSGREEHDHPMFNGTHRV